MLPKGRNGLRGKLEQNQLILTEGEGGKRQLMDTIITKVNLEDCRSSEKKRNQIVGVGWPVVSLPDVVLDVQHRLSK